MNYVLYDGAYRKALLPFTYTRPVADIRIGILTIREKWEKYLKLTTTTLTASYLSNQYPMIEMEQNIFINAGYIPNKSFFKAVKNIKQNQKIVCGENIIAFFTTADQAEVDLDTYETITIDNVESIQHLWDLFLKNDMAIRLDFELLTKNEISEKIPENVQVVGKEHIFIAEGATVFPCVLNASTGPIYIGKDATVLEGSLIRGPFALGEKSLVKMGAKIYGATTIGPNCRVGGEVKNSVLFANSNKSHEGYLGNSVIGEWCNFGADTNVSNLKNTYSKVLLWNYEQDIYKETQQQYCGLIMGDHCKTGINTMFNTGTVVGVNVNIFGAGLPGKFVPSFSWGGNKYMDTYNFKKAIKTAKKMMALSDQELSEESMHVLEHIFNETKKYRV